MAVTPVRTVEDATGTIIDDLQPRRSPGCRRTVAEVTLEERVRMSTDRRWTVAFVVTLFAIHSARLETDGTLARVCRARHRRRRRHRAGAAVCTFSSSCRSRCLFVARHGGSNGRCGGGISSPVRDAASIRRRLAGRLAALSPARRRAAARSALLLPRRTVAEPGRRESRSPRSSPRPCRCGA